MFPRHLLPLVLLATACPARGEGETESTSTTTVSPPTTTMTPATETGASLTCDQATTEEQCAQAMPSAVDDPSSCYWTMTYTATLEPDGTCTFEPFEGNCAPHAQGDTECGLHPAECGYEIYGEVTEDGSMLIGRTDMGCAERPPGPPLVLCDMLGEGTGGGSSTGAGEPSDDELLCMCGCSSAFPTE